MIRHRPDLTIVSRNRNMKPRPKPKYEFQSDLTAAQLATVDGMFPESWYKRDGIATVAQMRPADAVGDPIEAPTKLKLVQPLDYVSPEEEFQP